MLTDATTLQLSIDQILQNGMPLVAAEHDAWLEADRALYAALLHLPSLGGEDAMQIIGRLLAITEDARVGGSISAAQKADEDRLIANVLPHLPMRTVLDGFDALRIRKINNKRTSGWIRSYILGSPELERMAVTYRASLQRLLRHALGERSTQNCLRILQIVEADRLPHQQAFLRRHLLRYVALNTQWSKVQEIFLFLFGCLRPHQAVNPARAQASSTIKKSPLRHRLAEKLGNLLKTAKPSATQAQDATTQARDALLAKVRTISLEPTLPLLQAYFRARTNIAAGAGLPPKTLRGIVATFHGKAGMKQIARYAHKEKLKRDVHSEDIFDREDSLIGWMRRFCKERDESLFAQISTLVTQACATLPPIDAHITVLFDASASMRGFGFRQYNNLAIALSIVELLERRARGLSVVWLGAPLREGLHVEPCGATMLAPALLDAIAARPDLVILLSDGYENVEQGDAAKVLAGVRQLGLNVPVVQITPAFTTREILDGRRPLADAPLFLETGERGFLPLWLRLIGIVQPERLVSLLKETLTKDANP